MNESKPKKRLQMMPEVLPAPSVVTTGSVRRRTLARLRVLAALGAAGIAASCNGKVEGGGGDPSLPDAGGVDGGEDAYGVVDPLPPPTCFIGYPTATAHFTTESEIDDAGVSDAGADAGADGNHRLVAVDVSFADTGVVIGSAAATETAEVVSTSTTSTGARLVVRIEKGNVSANVTVQVSCQRGPDQLYIQLHVIDDELTVDVSTY